ncbi:MAG: zinc-binding dehydrogenase, partial [Steroidobacteraceae bacterium]
VIFECTGAAGMFATAIDLVRPGGSIVCLGICSAMDHFMPATAAYKEVSIRFSSAYSRQEFEATVDAFDQGGTEPREMVEDIIPLGKIATLLETMRAGASRATKIHVNPGSGSMDRNLADTAQH